MEITCIPLRNENHISALHHIFSLFSELISTPLYAYKEVRKKYNNIALISTFTGSSLLAKIKFATSELFHYCINWKQAHLMCIYWHNVHHLLLLEFMTFQHQMKLSHQWQPVISRTNCNFIFCSMIAICQNHCICCTICKYNEVSSNPFECWTDNILTSIYIAILY